MQWLRLNQIQTIEDVTKLHSFKWFVSEDYEKLHANCYDKKFDEHKIVDYSYQFIVHDHSGVFDYIEVNKNGVIGVFNNGMLRIIDELTVNYDDDEIGEMQRNEDNQ